MSALKVGAGTDSGVQVGPLVNRDAVDKVEELVGTRSREGQWWPRAAAAPIRRAASTSRPC